MQTCNVPVTAVRIEKNDYRIYLADRYIGMVAWLGSREELEAWFAPQAILDRLCAGRTPSDTELEIISLLS